jgi:hypothetical protein
MLREEPNTANGHPRVFISYSWDSEKHKGWVLELAKRLRADGIDAVVDEIHLSPGDRAPQFMETCIRQSNRVLVICTEAYKRRFDDRSGGAGYEGHIMSGEIISQVGRNKFIPILRSGDWNTAMPTALLGTIGIDLRQDSDAQYRKLVQNLYQVAQVPPVGNRPKWLDDASHLAPPIVRRAELGINDPKEYWDQRKVLPETDITRKIWSKPHWNIWIRPSEFRKARFQSVDQCRTFMLSSYVRLSGRFPYPSVSSEAIEIGTEWVAGEEETAGNIISRSERWGLFRSAQFVHNLTVKESRQLGDRIHVLEILDTVTAAFELAARMADRGVLSPDAVVGFELRGIEGLGLTWPQDIFHDKDVVPRNCWCQESAVDRAIRATDSQLKTRRRELARDMSHQIYAVFGWSDVDQDRIKREQAARFPAVD